ncbi:MAG: DNA-3-methyladenine glycosylase 2 family protein [Pseudomonadota bacterium]
MTPPQPEAIDNACEVLARRDPVLAKAYRNAGCPTWRTAAPNYASLARIVVYQLISTKAADAIWQRVLARHPTVSPRAILDDDPDGLLSCGLSRPKYQHLVAIATAVDIGALDFEALRTVPIDSARQTLLAIKGIGPWTAETFLMNAIGHFDAFPKGDVGLMESYRRLSDLPERPSAKALSEMAEAWRPYRAVAAHLLYAWLHIDRDDGT